MPDTRNRQVAGRYELTDELGKGGMGVVWRATDMVLKRQVAVKEVKLPQVLSSADTDVVRDRVMREARTAAGLGHPGAVTVFDVIQEDGHTFIVMELVDAPSLEDLVKRKGPCTPTQVAQIGLDVLGALEAAHAQGITHRDVKPGNVMIPDQGRAKLADFGIASIKGDPKLTATGLVLGSPSYMAPEQASKDIAGPESDLWALGATLYYAVEGEPPFDRGQAIPTLTAVVHDEPRPFQRAGALAPAIRQLLSKEPEARPTPSQLRRMLEDVVAGVEVDTRAATAIAGPATATAVEEDVVPPTAVAAAATEARPARVHSRPDLRDAPSDGKPWLLWLGAAVALIIVAALLIPNLTQDEEPTADTGAKKNANNSQRQDQNNQAAPADAQPAEDTDDDAAAEDTGTTEGFDTYTDSATGYQISYPAGWDVAPIDTRTDFREAGTGRYLRIQYTTEPGPNALERIEESIEPTFAADHGDYERQQLTEVDFPGADNAALWEYTYEGQRAYNLQFVNSEYGFALNFQTPEDQWEESQDLWETFKESFVLP